MIESKEARRDASGPGGPTTPAKGLSRAGEAGRVENEGNQSLLPENRWFITVEQFWKEMLGQTNRNWYYRHKDDPGFPQAFYFGKRPLLLYDDCLHYVTKQQRAAKRKRSDPLKDRPAAKITP